MSAGIKANADGSAAIQVGGSDAITITSGLNTTFAGTASVATGALYPLVSGTAVASTSGTSIDFTGIPSTAKRITVMFSGVSTSGASLFLVQIGDSGGFENTGYVSSSTGFTGAGGSTSSSTSGFVIAYEAANYLVSGQMLINSLGSNVWVEYGGGKLATNACWVAGGNKTLSDTLDRVRITTVNGTDTFDAGSINILWE